MGTAVESRGVGQALVRTCVEHARAAGCRRPWLIATDDGLQALPRRGSCLPSRSTVAGVG
ncbi:GNAT family N-acetyltransferase [Geodermatophilus sp. URMC 60]